jgi:hypothetical protein
MERLDRLTACLILGIGVLHCGVTFLLAHGFTDNALWFFSGGLAMIYCGALNLLRVHYARIAPGVRAASLLVNLSMLAFILAYAFLRGPRIARNPGALLLIACAVAATGFSLRQPRPLRTELRAAP